MLAFLALLNAATYGQAPPVEGDWQIILQDDFEGTYPDPSIWHQGGHALHFNGASSNGSDNISVEGGNLVIKAEVRQNIFAGKTYEYASGEITSFPDFRQAYGYFEARIKYDAIQGAWPAFWLMPDRGNRGPEEQMRQTFLKFTPDTSGGPVGSAILKVKVKAISSTGVSNITVHPLIENNWDETTVSWNGKPDFDPLWIRQLTGTTDPDLTNELFLEQFFEVDVTPFINQAIEANTSVGFALVDQFMRNVTVDLYSKEAADPDDRPFLLVDGVKVTPSDDAYVRGGTYADQNYGSESVIRLSDPWVSTSSTYNGAMEFDIMESLGIWGDDVTQHALHWDGYGDDHRSTGSGKVTYPATPDGYHIYGVHWRPGIIEFYIDGNKTWQYKSDRVASVSGYLILSLQLGGWDGNGEILDEQFPARMWVDWVRVYQDQKGALVRFTSPSEGDTITQEGPLKLTAESIEYGGEITGVDFLRNGSVMGTVNSPPYEFTWLEPTRGPQELIVAVKNGDGEIIASDTIHILVADIPEVTIISPVQGTVFSSPTDLEVELQASSGRGVIEKADFFINGELEGTDDSAPFSFTLAEVLPGIYRINAVVTDDVGLSATATEVIVEVTAPPVDYPWSADDIGEMTPPGTSGSYGDIFILENYGRDNWGNEDKLHYVYRRLAGDGAITARVDKIWSGSPSYKAGLMIRESLDPGAKMAAVSVRQEDGPVLSFRAMPGGYMSNYAYPDLDGEASWLRLAREGNLFSGYISVSGTEWVPVFAGVELELPGEVLTGLYVYANSTTDSTVVRIDSVSFEGMINATKPQQGEDEQPVDVYITRDSKVIVHAVRGGFLPGAELDVYSMDGTRCETFSIQTTEAEVDLGHLAPAVYILRFRSLDRVFTQKVCLR